MRVEDLVRGKKYRHPIFNVDLRFDEVTSSGFWFVRETKENGREPLRLYIDELEQLTEVREPFKKEQVSYSEVEFNTVSSYEYGSDVITGLYVCNSKDSIKALLADKSDSYKKKMIVKHITTSIELTKEEIQKELENE
jgi:hypothetical protein